MTESPRPGDRVRITGALPGDPDPLPIGLTGTVRRFNELDHQQSQVFVDWDNGRRLILLEVDPYEIIEPR